MPPARPALPAPALRRTAASPLAVVLRSRFHRSALLTLFCSGLATSAAIPQLTTFFVTDLGASLPVAGLYYLTNVTAPVVGFAFGRWSDRREDRLTLFRFGAVVGALGWVAMALATQIWMPFVISVLALGVAGAAGAQVYAAARDELRRKPTPADLQVMSTIRMAFTLGWVVGPVVGSVVGAAFGLRVVLLCTAAFAALQLVPMIGVRAPRYRDPQTDPQPGARPGARQPTGAWRELVPLLVFCALAILAASGDTIKFAYLPIYMSQHLGLPAGVRGAVIALQPVFELVLMPVAARLALRFGAMRLVLVGILFGVLANACYALSTTAVGLLAAQALMAGLWAVLAGLGVTVAQQLYPSGVGVASSTFLSSMVFASTVGGLLGSAFVETLGIPGVFVVPAVLCAASLAGMGLLARRLAGAATARAGRDLLPGSPDVAPADR